MKTRLLVVAVIGGCALTSFSPVSSAHTRRPALTILGHSSRVRRDADAFVVLRASRHALCGLNLRFGGHTVARTGPVRSSRSGEFEFVWRFPADAPSGAWSVVSACGSSARSITSKVVLVGRGHSRTGRRVHIAIRVTRVATNRLPSLSEPPATGAKGGGAYPAYGTPILSGSAWFNGHGVTVYSDGAPGGGGHWQCVELFERFINTAGWYHGLAGAGIVGAQQLFAAVSSASFDKHPNGSGYIPVPGDAVIFAGGRYGHVAIVDYVAGSHVGLVEQNASPSGRTTINLAGSTLGNDGPGLAVIGVLHAKANTTASAPAPNPQPQPGPSASGPVYGVQNTSESPPDGVFFRNSPHTADTSRTPGIGVNAGESVRLVCYAWGDAVGPHNDSLWYDVQNVTRPTSNGASNVGWLNAHYVNDGANANAVDAGVPVCSGYSATPPSGGSQTTTTTATTPPPPPTYSETVGGVTHTWTNYSNAGGTQGPSIANGQTVQIACKVTGFRVADGDTWWYRIASPPWSSAYYASADAFYNNGQTSGSLSGTPYVDPAVPDC